MNAPDSFNSDVKQAIERNYPSRVLAVIPARSGSRRCPGKNNRRLAGRPILQYTLDAIDASELIDDVLVVTDDQEFAHTAEHFGLHVIAEPRGLATPDAAVELAVEYATRRWERRHWPAEIIVICEPNVPIRPPGILDRAITRLQDSPPDVDGCLTIEPAIIHHPYWTTELHDGRISFPELSSTNCGKLPPRFHLTSAAYAYRRTSLAKVPAGYSALKLVSVLHPTGACAQIDTRTDALFAEFLVQRQSLEVLP